MIRFNVQMYVDILTCCPGPRLPLPPPSSPKRSRDDPRDKIGGVAGLFGRAAGLRAFEDGVDEPPPGSSLRGDRSPEAHLMVGRFLDTSESSREQAAPPPAGDKPSEDAMRAVHLRTINW